jgi:hypothetical protein
LLILLKLRKKPKRFSIQDKLVRFRRESDISNLHAHSYQAGFWILALVPESLLNIPRKAVLFDVWDKNGKSALMALF